MDDKSQDDYQINDFESEASKLALKRNSLKLKIIIATIICLLVIGIIIIIIILLSKNKNDKDEDYYYKKALGIINCKYKIVDASSPTPLLSKDFKKEKKIDILINNKKVDFSYDYKFSKIGNYNISFLFYDNLNMDNIFKDISSLIEIDMISNKNLKIISMKNSFENCINLLSFDISGFNINEVKSIHKLFYKTKYLENINLDIFEKNNIEDITNIKNTNEESFINEKELNNINLNIQYSNLISDIVNTSGRDTTKNNSSIENYKNKIKKKRN